jgi:hypothetical protein
MSLKEPFEPKIRACCLISCVYEQYFNRFSINLTHGDYCCTVIWLGINKFSSRSKHIRKQLKLFSDQAMSLLKSKSCLQKKALYIKTSKRLIQRYTNVIDGHQILFPNDQHLALCVHQLMEVGMEGGGCLGYCMHESKGTLCTAHPCADTIEEGRAESKSPH